MIPEGTIVGGRWRILGPLGAGGFGQVLLVEDASEVDLGRAAIKIVHPHTTPRERQDFLAEVKKMAALRHQNLVGYLDSGQWPVGGATPIDHDGEVRPYLVTELCERSLQDQLTAAPGGRLPLAETGSVLADVTAGLAHLHARGLIHRDIKPGNVLFNDGRWKLADFGLMRDLTATGSYHRGDLLMGTPVFMAPELFRSMTASAPADVYAIGVLAHLAATGRPVHQGAGQALIHNITSQPPSVEAGVDRALGGLISACVHPDPARRPTAAQLADHLSGRAGLVGGPVDSGPSAEPTIPGLGPRPEPVTPQPAPLEPPDRWAPPSIPVTPPPAPPPIPVAGPRPMPAGGPQPVPAGPPERASGGTPWLTLALLLGLPVVLLVLVGVWLVTGLMVAETTSADGGADVDPVVEVEEVSAEPDESSDGGGPIDDSGTEGGDPDRVGGEDRDGTGSSGPGQVDEPAEIVDAIDHFASVPCGAGPADTVEVTNRHDAPVDYRVTVDHLDGGGVRIAQTFEEVRALEPGQTALVGLWTVEDDAAGCEISELTAVETSPAQLATRGQARIDSCVLDDFFGNWYDITYTVTNPTDQTAYIATSFGIVDADGVRIDESFTNLVTGVRPGEQVRTETSEVFWTMDHTERVPVDCIVVRVEIEPDPTG